ncbi:MAG TPA: hypothetical protein VJZ27_02400, partial [Aggregatilineales bacterium]|nr:hypothetical protein [Aggregatilineales bacterium]
ETGLLADENTPEENREERVYLVLPPEARDWAARQGIPAPPIGAQIVGYEDQPVRLLNPDPFTVFQLTPVMPLVSQRIRLQVAVPARTESVVYVMDGEEIALADTAPFEIWWQLLPGRHEIRAGATLDTGETVHSDAIEFRVNSWVPPGERPISGDAE